MRQPAKPALTFGHRTWSYASLLADADKASQALTALGVRSGDRVVYFARNSSAYVIGWLGIILAGGVHVPANFMLQARELAFLIGHSQPRLAFADEDLIATLREAVALAGADTKVLLLEQCAPLEMDEIAPMSSAPDRPGPSRGGEDIAQIAYTSGTESEPKGAMLSHRALLAQYVSCLVEGQYERTDVVLHALPLYHCAQMHCFLMPYLALGAHNILIAGPQPADLLDAMTDHAVTSFFAPPTVWINLLSDPGFSQDRVPNLKKAYYGASIMPTPILLELCGRFPDLLLWNYYGQTELAPLAAVLPPADQLSRAGSAGRPALNVETMVVDPQMQPVEPGVVGEIVHRSPQLFSGYYGRDDLTKEAFSDGWFHSGDLAVVDDDGYLTIVDRRKDMINTGGENVSSREVEESLYLLPAIEEVAVVGVPDPRWIEQVRAFVVTRVGGQLTEADVVAHAKALLAPYKVPKSVVFVTSLPRNPSGKILKRMLRDTT
jgi:fatty-acyl-CoA synthase